VQFRRWQITLRWIMIRIAVIAVALAYVVDAARQSAKYHCGHPMLDAMTIPMLDAMTILLLLAVGNPLGRAMARAYGRTPPPPKP
jgi:hypothetical protein